MGDQEEKVTTGQERQPVSAPQGNSLEIYVFGDRARDEILIPARELPSGKTASGAHDSQTRYKAEKYTAACGTDLLRNLVLAYCGDDIVEASPEGGWAVETVSEWKRVPDKKKTEPEHLYLQRQNGYMENEDSTIEFEPEKITTSTIAVIYNMVSKLNAEDAEKQIAESIERCPASIIRARWNESTLLKELLRHEDVARKAILVFNTDGLRQAGLNIRPGISWEQMVLETKQVVAEMTVEVEADDKRETKKVLELCKAVIVCMKHEGCML